MNPHRTSSAAALFVLFAALASAAAAQSPPAKPGTDEVEDLLGSAFTSVAAGVSFRPPANCIQYRGIGGDDIVQYVDEKRDWVLKVGRIRVSEPLPLVNYPDKFGIPQKGLMEITLDHTKETTPGAEVLRSDIVPLTDCNAAMIAIRYTVNAQRKLTQQAILQAHPSTDPKDPKGPPRSTLYYVFNFTTPAASSRPDQPKLTEDPREKLSVDVFRQVLDSVKLIDNENLRKDQEERLIRARALFVNWSAAYIHSKLQAEQFLRVIRDGKDIGYMYVVEQPELRAAVPGVQIGIHSTTWPDAGESASGTRSQADLETWMWSTCDRKHESWSSIAYVVSDDGKKKPDSVQRANVQEFGSADLGREVWDLTVKRTSAHGNAKPVTRQVPPFYIPQAIGHLLPRLLPIKEPKTYMFATYVGQQQEVMSRYMEVEKEQEVTLAGQKVRAVAIRDRIGFEGSVTVHYFSPYPDGNYLGSYSKDSGVTILPADRQTILQLFPAATFKAPDKLAEGAAPAPPAETAPPAPARRQQVPGRIPNRTGGTGR